MGGDILPGFGDETVHYMESTSRLKAENENLRKRLDNVALGFYGERLRADEAEATMRDVAEELRKEGAWTKESICFDLADRLDPPPKEDH